MSYEESLKTITVEASGDLSGDQYKIVGLDTNGRAAVLSSVGAKPLGVLQDKPSALGRPCSVAIGGVSKVKLGGTVAADAEVTSTAAGLGSTAATGNYVLGTLVAGGVNNDVAPVSIAIYQKN